MKPLVLHFAQRFKEKTGETYPIVWGKDMKLMKELLQLYDYDKLIELIDLFFETEDPFVKKAGYSVGVFKAVLLKLLSGKVKTKEWGETRGGDYYGPL